MKHLIIALLILLTTTMSATVCKRHAYMKTIKNEFVSMDSAPINAIIYFNGTKNKIGIETYTYMDPTKKDIKSVDVYQVGKKLYSNTKDDYNVIGFIAYNKIDRHVIIEIWTSKIHDEVVRVIYSDCAIEYSLK